MKLKKRFRILLTFSCLIVVIFAKSKRETFHTVPASSIGTAVVYEDLEKPEFTVSEEIPRETEEIIFEEETLVVEEELLPEEDIRLIALVTMAEAEGESEEGKRLVISTILNRVDSEHFPNTVHDVVYQPNHFSSVWNGRIDRCEVRDDIYKLVEEELKNRSDYDVIFFTAGAYGKYGNPMFQVGNHYFASY